MKYGCVSKPQILVAGPLVHPVTMAWLFPRKMSLENLRDHQIQRNQTINISKKRHAVQIACIDDKKFAPLESLKGNGYNIVQFSDIENVNQIIPYPIVLCDLHGVGLKLNPETQGAHVIKEIKLHFPDKYVVAYTAGTTDEMVQAGMASADRYIGKDFPIDEWIQVLDEACDKHLDPVYYWKRLRVSLLDSGTTPQQLVELENVYVKSILGVEPSRISKKKLIETGVKIGLSVAAKAVLSSLLGSSVHDLVWDIFSDK